MNDLLSKNLETVRLTATVKHDGQFHGPGYVVAAPRAQTDAWIAAGKAEAYKPRKRAKDPAGDKTDPPDLTHPDVRTAVAAAMVNLPVDPEHFTNAGLPEIKAVTAAVSDTLPGLVITAAQRDEIWAEIQAGKENGGE